RSRRKPRTLFPSQDTLPDTPDTLAGPSGWRYEPAILQYQDNGALPSRTRHPRVSAATASNLPAFTRDAPLSYSTAPSYPAERIAVSRPQGRRRRTYRGGEPTTSCTLSRLRRDPSAPGRGSYRRPGTY